MFKLEVLQEKPWYLQAAVFGGIALVIYLGFWYFITGSTRSETREIEARVEELQRANAGAQIASQRLNEFKANYAAAQADYDDLKALLPEQRELTMVLQNLQDRAKGKLTLRRFTPKDEVQQDFYSGKPVEVEVSGTYNNVGQFFAQMATYQRIVSITDFRVGRLKDGLNKDRKEGKTVSAFFLLTAYYVSPEKLVPTAPAQPNGQPAANGAAAPPAAANPANPTAAAGAAATAGSNAATAGQPK
jgi:type IV pilus assembly protein PilO